MASEPEQRLLRYRVRRLVHQVRLPALLLQLRKMHLMCLGFKLTEMVLALRTPQLHHQEAEHALQLKLQ
jgi:hypothetical protein